MSNSIATISIKKLYALSAGRCNICKESLFEGNVHIGEMAHVIAKSPKGPRGDEMLPNDNSYENLILLCSNHHTYVDNDPFEYTIQRLHEIKNEHELYIFNATNFNSNAINNKRSDIDFLNTYFFYTPFGRVLSLIDSLPNSYHIDLSILGDQFEIIVKCLPASYPLNDNFLQDKFNDFIERYYCVDKYLFGRVSISECEDVEVYNGANYNLKCFLNFDHLPVDKANIIVNELTLAKHNLVSAYNSLITYLRTYYPEVNIYSSI